MYVYLSLGFVVVFDSPSIIYASVHRLCLLMKGLTREAKNLSPLKYHAKDSRHDITHLACSQAYEVQGFSCENANAV